MARTHVRRCGRRCISTARRRAAATATACVRL